MGKINYPYLPEGREILYVPESNPFMAEAKKERNTNSTENNHPTGAVVVFGGKIIGRGANQAAIKNKFIQNFHRDFFCIRRMLKIKTGTKYWLCPGCADFHNHAEVLAVADAVKNRGDIAGADLYLYGHWWCCRLCWDAMVSAGIKNVYLLRGSE
ncbi:MAG: hypothetical protein UX94_C0011G0042 [Parcubacteria group bacterium GW2011_GWA2_47_21]|nr:MAG: hypothetical protein UX94_C0011G0042 [Parcubacteria group bacterium GW2011_GWA2_47_21]